MAKISHLVVAKSDQLNAQDLMGIEKVLTITGVKVPEKKSDEPLVIHYEGENGRPWKITSVSVMKILQRIWGEESDKWVGQSISVHCDEDVMFGKERSGGVRPHAMTGLDTEISITVLERPRTKNPYRTYKIRPLKVSNVAGKSVASVPQYSFEGYTKFIRSVIAMDDPEAMKARFEKAQDWRLKAVEENRDEATKLREEYEARLEELSSGSNSEPE